MLHDTSNSGDTPSTLTHFKIISVVVLGSLCFSSTMQLWFLLGKKKKKIQSAKSYSGITEVVLYHWQKKRILNSIIFQVLISG